MCKGHTAWQAKSRLEEQAAQGEHPKTQSQCWGRGGAVGTKVRDQTMEMLDAKSRPGLDPVGMESRGRFGREARQG